MKKIAASIIIGLLCFSMFSIFAPRANASDAALFEDNFESYTTGAFPSSGGWALVYNGAGTQNQIVTDACSHSPTKSLQLLGIQGNSANAWRQFTSSSESIGYEGYMRAESNTGNADHVSQMSLCYDSVYGRLALVQFDEDGNMYTAPKHLGPVYVSLGPYEANRWYKFRVVVDRATSTYSVWVDDVKRQQDILITDSQLNSVHYLMLESGHAQVKTYFDDVKVFDVREDQLVGYWKFDEGSGATAYDNSGNGNTGTLTSNPQWVNGVVGTSLEFDGIDDVVMIPDSPSLVVARQQNQLTLETWIRPTVTLDSSTTPTYLILKGNEYGFELNNEGDAYNPPIMNGKIRFCTCLVSQSTHYLQPEEIWTNTNVWTAGTWYHLAATYDENSLKIYVNGVLENSRPLTGNLWPTDYGGELYPLSIGAYTIGPHPSGNLFFFKGILDEVKVYNYARTEEEIRNDYGSGIVSLPWKDDFNYATKDEMKTAGWILSGEEKISLSPSIIRFDNDGSSGSGAKYSGHFLSGINEYSVEAKSRWVGRSYAQRYFNVWTKNHKYMWYGDGYYPNYCFMRDDVEVLPRFGGYSPTFNEWSVFKLEKKGNTFYMYENDQLRNTYVETDTTPDELIGVSTGAGWISTMEYDYVSVTSPWLGWSKTYGGTNQDCAYSLVQTTDGGFALAGETRSFGAGSTDFYLVRTDSSGNMIWDKTYGGTGADEAHSLVKTNDGGYALAGVIDYASGSGDFWLVKTDENGNQQWNKTFGGTNEDFAYSVIQTSDGGYAITGYTSSFGTGGRDFWLVKTDSNGEMQWNETYGGLSDDQARCVIQTNDGGYAIVGYTSSFGAGSDDVWLIKTGDNGTMLWNMTYGGAERDCGSCVIQTTDDGYALVGIANFSTGSPSTGGDAWLIKTRADGNVLWDKTFGGSNSDDMRCLIQTQDGGYALVGATDSYGAGSWDGWLVKTDAAGNIKWNQTYGETGEDWLYSLVQIGSNRFAMAGYTKSFGVGNADFWLVTGEHVNLPPLASFTESATSVPTGTLIYFNASASYDPDGSIVSYFWNFGDGTNATGVYASHAYAKGGNYTVTLTATDNDGATASSSDTKSILNKAPSAGFSVSPTTIFTNDVVTFNASASNDPDGTIVDYSWALGDETNGVGMTVDHSYATAGSYVINLTVTDDDGATASTGLNVTVLTRPDIAVTNVTISKTIVGIGQNLTITIVVENHGDRTESFSLNIYANETIVTAFGITLSSGESRIISYKWNTTGFAIGRYNVTATAEPLLGEDHSEDNTNCGGIVTISILGDVNGDGKVDVKDVYAVARAFGSYGPDFMYPGSPPHPRWNPNYDINDDNKIDVKDYYIVCKHYGELYP